MAKQLKRWQGWLLFFGVMVVVFVLGMTVSSLMERRAEVASIFNNRKVKMDSIEVDNQKFKEDFPLEYETWAQTSDTTFDISTSLAFGLFIPSPKATSMLRIQSTIYFSS